MTVTGVLHTPVTPVTLATLRRERDSRDCSVTVTPVTPQTKIETKNKNLPPTVPQRGTGADDLRVNASEAKEWLNELFGRKRAWSYEEDSLLSTLLPISREDRELIQWGYSLRRDSEGWALINGKRITKPKQSLLMLLREFSSELDKWQSARMNGNGAKRGDGWTPERKKAAREEFPEATFPAKFEKLPVAYQCRIDERVARRL